ncbi:glycosyltransferase [Mycobacterium paraffinicum]|uniref:Glycosyltransferase n=1 Tax=Mycobacterium paraffinicum TaxID=53378 RepID=A0ABP8RBN8_9MYCO|nr:glycosyltransferase [Mycobacterium paraffinicum]MCV7312344.1 glycosyltransferase [Mycobacterium paraffinicum]
MRFVLAMWGTRGDVEPCCAIGRELLRRGHDVCMAIPPDFVGFVESTGVAAVAYGAEPQYWLDAHRNFFRNLLYNFWRILDLRRLWRDAAESAVSCWGEMSTVLVSLADGADVILTGMAYQEIAANVAEYYDIPLSILHFAPVQPNGRLRPYLPAWFVSFVTTGAEWLMWPTRKNVEEAQRRDLGLPKETRPAFRRIIERAQLEIQAYDEMCFPGLAAEWARWNGRRPFVGALTLELPTDDDEEVASWIAAGTPPIYFGFGSVAIESPSDTLAMISAACAQLGERALVCAGGTDFGDLPRSGHVKVVDTVNHAAVFPSCRAVVHHGGAGTTAAGLRAGVRTVVLWRGFDQPHWGAVVKRLKIGTARRFSRTTQKSLVADLRTVLTPQYAARAREIAPRMTEPTASVAAATALLENLAGARPVG